MVTFYIAITPLSGHTSLRWFGLSTCIGEPGGPTSIASTAHVMTSSFYIVITSLSGRTTRPLFAELESHNAPRTQPLGPTSR